jgi:alpha-2-macroglobulin
MRLFFAVLGFASLALVVTTSGQTFGPAPARPFTKAGAISRSAYENLLVTARQHAAEKSWALTRDSFAAARPLAPDSEATRWCDLWILDASWRALPRDNREENQRFMAAFDSLLAPYLTGRARDDFWIACLESRAAAKRYRYWEFREENNSWSDELAIADHLASQPVNSTAATRYVDYVSTLPPRQHDYLPLSDSQRVSFFDHLSRAAQVSPDRTTGARLALHAIELASRFFPNNADRLNRLFTSAASTARGTPLEPAVHARSFLSRAQTGSLVPDKDGRPDLPVWLREIDSLLFALAPAPSDEPFVASARKSLVELKTRWSERRIELAIGNLFRPDEPLRFTLGTAYISKLDVEIHRVTPHDWHILQSQKHTDKIALPVSPNRVLAWSLNLVTPAAAPHHWQSRIESFPSPLPPGLYLLLVRDEAGATQLRPFAITAAAGIALRTGDNRWEFFCYNNKTHALLTPRAAQVWTFPNVGEPIGDPVQGALDASGRIVTPLPTTKNPRSALLVLDDGQPVVFDSLYDYERWRNVSDDLLIDAFLPRELYRPGETVYWKLLARHRRDGRFVNPDGKLTLKISIDDTPLGEPREITWDDTGSASGDLVIPVSTRPGRAKLALFSGEEEVADMQFFTVDNFLPPPAFTSLELIDDPSSLRPDSTATFRVNARYFSGGPITGAPVEFNLVPHLPDSRFNAAEDESQNESISANRAHWQRETSTRVFHATTDAAGFATCSLDLPDFLPPAFFLTITHTVKPSGLPELRGNKSLTVTSSGLHLDFPDAAKPRFARPGEKITLRFRYLDAFERPAPLSGEVSLIESRWQEVWLDPAGQPVTGPALATARRSFELAPDADLPAGWKKIHAENATSVIATEDPVLTPDGWATVTFAPPHPGCFRFEFNSNTGAVTTNDPAIIYGYQAASDNAQLYAVDDTTRTLDLPPGQSRLIGPAEITTGEKPRFLALLPENTRHGFITLNGETETRTQAFTTEGRVALVTFENPPVLSGLASARLILPGRTSSYAPDHSFTVRHPENTISTEIVLTSAETRPGAADEIILRTRDHAQRPISSTVAFAVSDQAVNQLLSEKRETTTHFLSYDTHFESSVFQTYAWQKKPLFTRLADPRDGLGNYRSVTADEHGDLVELSAFAVESLRDVSARGLMGSVSELRSVISADAFGGYFEVNVDKLRLPTLDDLPSSKPVITLRRHFASTAFWAPSVKTDANGEARVSFKYPDNLTEWRLAAYAVGHDGNSFGTATAFTRTSLPFQARLQTPRFLIAGDTADLSATVLNRTTSDVSATAELQLTDSPLSFVSTNDSTRSGLTVPHEGEARTAWSVHAAQPGTATLTLTAHTSTEGDAMQLPLPVHEDSIQQSTAASARLARDVKSSRFTITLPSPLDPARTDVVLHLSPSRAATVLDALPYVIDYPYGCVEQTMSRFLPAVLVKETLTDFGLDPSALEKRILAQPAHRSTQPPGSAPAFAKLDDVITQSLSRLAAAKNHDGFGWWPGSDEPDLWMTAYVAWGLALADDTDITLPEDLASETNDALEELLADNPPDNDTTAWALAAAARALGKDATDETKKTFARLFASRDVLSAYGRACLLLASAQFGEPGQRAILLRNLENGATRHRADDFGDTVHWGKTSGFWRATNSAVETTALTLLALLETDAKHPLIEPAVNWLVLNRRSAHWTNTRDTAFAIVALTRYIAVSEEIDPDVGIEVLVNGRSLRRLTFDAGTLLAGDTILPLDTAQLRAGENKIELRRLAGRTPVYALALSSAWARGESIRPAGHLATVARSFERQKTHATLAGTFSFTPESLGLKGSATAGEQITARVTLTIPNDLEYVMVEVPKPAGCEPLNPLSGWDARLVRVEILGQHDPAPEIDDTVTPDEGLPIYREERDDKSVFFLDQVAAGTWEIRFSLRAVHPGDYRALPVHAEAMYAPEVRTNSDVRRLIIKK